MVFGVDEPLGVLGAFRCAGALVGLTTRWVTFLFDDDGSLWFLLDVLRRSPGVDDGVSVPVVDIVVVPWNSL